MKEQEQRTISSIEKLFRGTPKESAKESNRKEIIRHAERNIKQNQKRKDLTECRKITEQLTEQSKHQVLSVFRKTV